MPIATRDRPGGESIRAHVWVLLLGAALAGRCDGSNAQAPDNSVTDAPRRAKQAQAGASDREDAAARSGEAFEPPTPAGADAFVEARLRMVELTIAHPRDGRRAVRDERVIEAMKTVPRHAFVPDQYRARAYVDSPLPIGHGQTISQPYIVALMTEQLAVTPESKVLEIGTGSGYQAAVLAHLTPHVYTIEIIDPLAEQAKAALREQGYDGVQCQTGDGYFGWKETAPFDAIIVTCAAGHLPPPLWEQLAPGGRIVVPIGGQHELQRLVVMKKTEEGKRRSETITAVRFVPMTGEIRK